MQAGFAGMPGRMPGRGPMMMDQAAPISASDLIQSAQFIIAAQIDSFQEGIATRSMPPQCHYKIAISNVQQIRGTLPQTDDLKLIIVGFEKPIVGELLVLLGHVQDDHFSFNHQLKMTFEEAQKIAEANPPGWQNGASPFTQQFDAKINLENAVICPKSGRPSFKLQNFSMKVEQVKPEVHVEYQNTYGDGLFTVAITNNGPAQTCNALFQDKDGSVLIEQSLILKLSSMGAARNLVFDAPLPENITQVAFSEGETKTFEINVLKLKSMKIEQWPRGGMRVYIQFVLGDIIESNFFYYSSKHHDALVEKAVQE
ncbi:hypothetical protein SS50377_25874 [Spironucleus salmonicida]|uniref:Uncharacterized protein n=1 Tax=Spironucleus salmonicida TaxID=348837 RepID=V6LUB0_9EUKA|nr:hypothetical protein SS50377_25874 [Spironucleus salmonicida]|eukprot:EST48207.1 hypothetical protein SS50377_11647 [Spironucleus salmonicida]